MKEICWLNLKSMMVINQVTYSININCAPWLRCTYSITITYYNVRERERERKNEKWKKRMLLTKNVVNKITRCRNNFFFRANWIESFFSLVIMCRITMPPIRSVASQQRFSTGNKLNKKNADIWKFFIDVCQCSPHNSH